MAVNPVLSVGDAAPSFILPSDTKGDVSLAKLKGKKVVLYFYPKDLTPGCTNQACDFRDNIDALTKAGWTVLGVSPDPVERHAKFREKHDLNFPLLADTENEVARAY
ncbi:MAG: peroxiredoxin, partial [Bradymonadaceae bacterium]